MWPDNPAREEDEMIRNITDAVHPQENVTYLLVAIPTQDLTQDELADGLAVTLANTEFSQQARHPRGGVAGHTP